MEKKVVVFGDNVIAEMVYLDSLKQTSFEIAAFCVDEHYLKSDSFCNKPMVGFKKAIALYPPNEYDMISTVDAPSRLRNRLIVFNRIKEVGYTLRNYISPLADVCPDVVFGENNIIFQFVYIGCRVQLGNANLVRQNIYLGHDSIIGNGNTLAAGCTFAGFCHIGDSCFLGINSSYLQNTRIADETLVGAGSVLTKDTEPYTVYMGNPARPVRTHKETGIMITARR
jgi:sugar O-acyltransferase (sialic acid O-acetyltransferase NeuD family)